MRAPLARQLVKSRRPPPIYPSLAVRSGIDSGVHRLLETPLSINGAVGSTILRWVGSQAAAGGWPEYAAGGTLTVEAGTPTFNAPSPYLGALDGGCKFPGSSRFVAPSAGLGAWGTNDFVIEAVVIGGAASNGRLFWRGDGASSAHSYGLIQKATTINFNLRTETPSWVEFSVPCVAGQCVHLLILGDRSGSATGYGNAVAGSALDISGYAAYTDYPVAFTLGGGAVDWDGTILYWSIHHRASGWLDSHLQPALALQRLSLLFGSRPLFSWGGATGPTACGSTTPAYQRKTTASVQRLHYIGAGAPRFERVLDADGRELVGALVEPGESNYATNSTALVGTEFSNNTLTPSAAVAPDGSATMTRLVEKTSVATPHGRCVGSIASALNDVFSVSCYVRDAGDRLAGVGLCCANHGVVSMAIVNPATGEVGSYINSHHALVGTVGVERLDSGLYRLNARFMDNLGSCGSQMCFYGLADSLSSGSFAGDAVAHPNGALFWGAQFSKSSLPAPSSLIVTGAAAATRLADTLRYDLTHVLSGAQGAVRFRFLAPAPPQVVAVLLSLDEGVGDNRIEVDLYGKVFGATSGYVSAISRKAAGTDGDCAPAGNLADNRIHEVMISWCEGRFDFWVDGALTRDTSCTPPLGSSLTRLNIGASYAASWQCGPVLVGDLKVSPRYQSSWTRRWTGFSVLS